MQTTTLKIRGMTCGGCVASVQRVLADLDGVARADVSLASNEAKIEYDASRVQPADLEAAVEDAGYEILR